MHDSALDGKGGFRPVESYTDQELVRIPFELMLTVSSIWFSQDPSAVKESIPGVFNLELPEGRAVLGVKSVSHSNLYSWAIENDSNYYKLLDYCMEVCERYSFVFSGESIVQHTAWDLFRLSLTATPEKLPEGDVTPLPREG